MAVGCFCFIVVGEGSSTRTQIVTEFLEEPYNLGHLFSVGEAVSFFLNLLYYYSYDCTSPVQLEVEHQQEVCASLCGGGDRQGLLVSLGQLSRT